MIKLCNKQKNVISIHVKEKKISLKLTCSCLCIKDVWNQLAAIETATCGFTLAKAIACAVEFDNQHCGIYAGDWDSYR